MNSSWNSHCHFNRLLNFDLRGRWGQKFGMGNLSQITLPCFATTIGQQQVLRGENFNRTLALRGQKTNASFKQWVGILLMPKIDRAHKNYLTPEIWEETHLREIFYGTLIFQQSSMICIGRHVGGHTLPLQFNMVAKTTFFLYLVRCLIVTLRSRCALNIIPHHLFDIIFPEV